MSGMICHIYGVDRISVEECSDIRNSTIHDTLTSFSGVLTNGFLAG